MPRHATILALCAWLSSPAAQAAETVFSCDVVQESSGTRYPEIITLDTERGVITHLKREWLDGRSPISSLARSNSSPSTRTL